MDDGIITGFRIILNPQKMGLDHIVYA